MAVKNRIEHLKVNQAHYIDAYRLSIVFNDGKNTVVDFKPFLETRQDGFLKKYQAPHHFKRFAIEDGNLVWGKNWDLIFPIAQLYKGKIKL